MSVTTWLVVEVPAVRVSKKPTSCLRTDFRYSILIREVCLSAVLVQHCPSAKANINHNETRNIARLKFFRQFSFIFKQKMIPARNLVKLQKQLQLTYEGSKSNSNCSIKQIECMLENGNESRKFTNCIKCSKYMIQVLL
jgi:hypothetical protein